ncbi:hypothetical protein [Vibrio sp.]|uniref:hypothetical protein n=1 Tax=Vibrio sp. TaxID=678 RepID=UPI0037AFE8D9
MKEQEQQSAEVVINTEQLQHLDAINEEQAAPDELQPKILAILGKIEANTSALLRQSVTLPASHRTVSTRTAQANNNQASNQHQIDTQSVSNKYQTDIRPSSSAASKAAPVNVSVVNAKGAKSERTVTATAQEKQTPSVALPGTQAGGSHSVAPTSPTATVAPSKPQKRTARSPEPAAENKTTNSAQDNTNKQVLPRHVKSNKPKAKADQQQTPDHDSTAPKQVTPKAQPAPNLPAGAPEQDSSSDTPSSSQQAQDAQREQREQKSFLSRIGSAFQTVASKSEEMANDESEGKAKDAVGSAMGGSLWDAALEVKELADDVSNSSIGQKVIGKVKPPKDEEDEDGDQPDPVDTPVRGEDGRFLSREERQKRVSETASRNDSRNEQVALESQTSERSNATVNTDTEHAQSSSISAAHQEETTGTKEAVVSSHEQSESRASSSDKDEDRSTKTRRDHAQSNTNQVSDSRNEQVAAASKSERSSVSDQHQDVQSVESKSSSNQSDIKEVLNQYQSNTTNKQVIPEPKASPSESTQAGSALVAMERDKDKQTDSITDRLDEQALATDKNHKELVKTIEQKNFGGSEEGGMADSLFDMLGGEGGDDKKGKNRKGSKTRGKRGRFGRMVDKIKSKIPMPDFLSKQGGKLSKVAEGAKSAASATKSAVGNSAIGNTVKAGGKIAGGALKTVGSVASKAAAPVAALTAGYFKYDEIKNRDDLTGGQKAVQVGATTAGSMGGASAGMMAGAAMGSVVPVVGTVIGGLLGAALGGWLGSKGGDIVGEAVTDRMKGTDGMTKADREIVQASESKEVSATNSDTTQSDITTTATVVKESSSEAKQQEVSTHAVQEVSPEQLKVTLPEIPKSQQQQASPQSNHSQTTKETATEIDYKKMGKVFEDALNKTQQSNVAAPASSGRYGGSNRTEQPSSSQQINTEFDDKTLVLMAHDRI